MGDKIKSGQYLTFQIGDEFFGLEVFCVKEILEIPAITVVPGMSKVVRGIVNIRGLVVPVIDVKQKFIGEKTEIGKNSVIIVIELHNSEGTSLMGIMADSARSVINLTTDDIEEPPSYGSSINKNYLKGVGKVDDGFILLINSQMLFSEEELNSVTDGVF
ncbi:MAG: chemotaxis protein CheW [Spirochaetales bacterium]|nr:chemotaxis protein CheW [Spirochaetales bacterium]